MNLAVDTAFDCYKDVMGERYNDDFYNDVLGGYNVLGWKHLLELMIGQNKTHAHLNTDLCTCTSVFLPSLPMCGSLGYLKGNLSLFMPFCDITKKCPSIDVVPLLDASLLCHNQSIDDMCMYNTNHPCVQSTKALVTNQYFKSFLDCGKPAPCCICT